MLEFQNHVDITYDYLMYPQEKAAEKCEKYMTLLPANGYKEKGKRTAAKFTRRVESALTQ